MERIHICLTRTHKRDFCEISFTHTYTDWGYSVHYANGICLATQVFLCPSWIPSEMQRHCCIVLRSECCICDTLVRWVPLVTS